MSLSPTCTYGRNSIASSVESTAAENGFRLTYQAAANTFRTVFGAATATFGNAFATSLGSRRPCSQSRNVRTDTLGIAAKSACD